MTWILLVVLVSIQGRLEVDHIEFSTHEACEAAAQTIADMGWRNESRRKPLHLWSLKTLCVEKG